MNTKQSETLLNDSRERQSRKIHRNRGTISIRRNDKGIPHFCLHNFKVKLSFACACMRGGVIYVNQLKLKVKIDRVIGHDGQP